MNSKQVAKKIFEALGGEQYNADICIEIPHLRRCLSICDVYRNEKTGSIIIKAEELKRTINSLTEKQKRLISWIEDMTGVKYDGKQNLSDYISKNRPKAELAATQERLMV